MMRPALLFTAIALSALPRPAPAQEATSNPDALAPFAACAKIAADRERHRCLDAALRSTGIINEKEEQARRQENFGRTPAQVEAAQAEAPREISAPPPAGALQPAVAAAKEPARRSEPGRESLQATVASARLIGRDRIVVRTAEAGDWASVERETFRRTPQAGDPFEIIPGSLGGYRCRIERTTLFACRRID